LAKSSPVSLFKFKIEFYFDFEFISESFKLFFDGWKGRKPMLLQVIPPITRTYVDFLEKYKAEGIIKKYDNIYFSDDFEWYKCYLLF
jgi:hypothetical protein